MSEQTATMAALNAGLEHGRREGEQRGRTGVYVVFGGREDRQPYAFYGVYETQSEAQAAAERAERHNFALKYEVYELREIIKERANG